jgi:twitching motility two-component system response regulator PilG
MAQSAGDRAHLLSLLRRARVAVEHGNKRMALELLGQILEADPEYEAALLLASQAAAGTPDAEYYLAEAIRVNPSNSEAMTSLALLRLSQGSEPERPAAETGEGATNAGRPSGKVLWVCPLCQEGVRVRDRIRCPHCGAVLAIEHIERVQANRGADEAKLLEAMGRWKERAAVDPGFEPNLNMARIMLNLNRSGEALPYLRAACKANPVATELKILFDLLERRPVVIAADESATVRRIISILVSRAGYLALSASDGLEALALLDTWTPAMMFVGTAMSRMDGYEVCEMVRAYPQLAELPVIILFDQDGFFVKMKGAMAGATDYLVKPVEEGELMKLMMRYAPTMAAR